VTSVVSPAPAVKPTRQRKPLEPVSVSAHFVGGATRQDVLDGAAVLSITDKGTTDEQAYWCEALFQAKEDGGKCVGFRLRKFNSAEVYDLPRALDSCTCADATYRPERPGGCRHQHALQQALPTAPKEEPAQSNAA
jgi:hypothetical protein